MEYKLHNEGHLIASSLMKELPDLTTERVEELFGPRDWDAESHFSNGITVHNSNGRPFSLYMRDGQWRIGGFSQDGVEDFAQYLMERG